jgi:heme-degrading monooxygenase HmoA
VFVRVFQYTASPGKTAEFEHAYGDKGDWVRLFAGADGYLGSTLERGDGGRYRTQDHWRSAADFTAWLASNRQAYDEIDRLCAPLKLTEEHCGHFTQPQPAGDEWTLVT